MTYWDRTAATAAGTERGRREDRPAGCRARAVREPGQTGHHRATRQVALLVSCLMVPVRGARHLPQRRFSAYAFGGRTPVDAHAAERGGQRVRSAGCAINARPRAAPARPGRGRARLWDFCPDTSQCQAAAAAAPVGGARRAGQDVVDPGSRSGSVSSTGRRGRRLSLRGDDGLVWSGSIPAHSRGWVTQRDGGLEGPQARQGRGISASRSPPPEPASARSEQGARGASQTAVATAVRVSTTLAGAGLRSLLAGPGGAPRSRSRRLTCRRPRRMTAEARADPASTARRLQSSCLAGPWPCPFALPWPCFSFFFA
jgi:hypothetical protein